MRRGSSRRASRDFSKAWNRDAHLPKLDPRLLPALRERWWTAAELTDYCRERRRNRLLETSLVERWLVSAEERGLARNRGEVDGQRWEATDYGRAHAGFLAAMLQKMGGLPGTLSVISILIALFVDRIPDRFLPIVLLPAAYLVLGLLGMAAGRVMAERSRALLRRVVERERLVQASSPSEPATVLDALAPE